MSLTELLPMPRGKNVKNYLFSTTVLRVSDDSYLKH